MAPLWEQPTICFRQTEHCSSTLQVQVLIQQRRDAMETYNSVGVEGEPAGRGCNSGI